MTGLLGAEGYHGGVSGKRDGLGPGPAPVLPPSPGECGTGCGVSLRLREKC